MHLRTYLLGSIALTAVVAAPRIAQACGPTPYPRSITAKEVKAHAHVVVVKVTKLTPGTADSRYTPPFTFEGTVVRTLKGSLKSGAAITGKTTTTRFRNVCPASLRKGATYLLFLNDDKAKPKQLVMKRFRQRYVNSRLPGFAKAVRQVSWLVKRANTRNKR